MVRPPVVSAVIINWNGGEMVAGCLRSLLAQSHQPIERVVVDNGSTDGSVARLGEQDDRLRVISNPENRGFAAAANQGIAATSGDWILLLNQDVVLELDYVARLLKIGQRDPTIGALTGKLLRQPSVAAGPRVVDSAGHILYRNGWAANRGEGLPDQPEWDQAVEVFGVSAAAALYRRSMVEAVSESSARPFDERFFAYIEDVDLDWRARLLGWKAWYVPAVAWHVRGASGVRRQPSTLRRILRNRLLLVANNDLWPSGLARLPGVGALALLTALQFSRESPPAVLGIVDALFMSGSSLRRRRFIRARGAPGQRSVEGFRQPFPYRRVISGRLRQRLDRAALAGGWAQTSGEP